MIEELCSQSAIRHNGRLCPRQALGVRMGLAGAAVLGIEVPIQDKRLLIIVETDGCFVDGIEAATGCSPGHRTLRMEDFGKVGATFIHVESGHAVRLAPKANVRQRAMLYAPEEERKYYAQLYGYQRMPDKELFSFKEVTLRIAVDDLISRPGRRVNCEQCGEEIINNRQVYLSELCLCRACAGAAYYVEHLSLPHVETIANER